MHRIPKANGELEVMTLKKIDSVMTGHLTERKDEVRALRKALNLKSEAMCTRMAKLHQTFQVPSFEPKVCSAGTLFTNEEKQIRAAQT
jgi:hypothetical protein